MVPKAADEELAVPEGRGTCKLLGEIARRGMSVVLERHDEGLGRDVATRVTHEELRCFARLEEKGMQGFGEHAWLPGLLDDTREVLGR